MRYRGYLFDSATHKESFVTTIQADNEREALASLQAYLGDHKRVPPGQQEVRVYSDESPGFTQTVLTVR